MAIRLKDPLTLARESEAAAHAVVVALEAEEPISPPAAWPRTDRDVQPKPPLPDLPPAGGTFQDPVFHSTILRVTDAHTQSDPTSYRSPSATMNRAWTADSKKFYTVVTTGGVLLWDFDPVIRRTSAPRQLKFDALDPIPLRNRFFPRAGTQNYPPNLLNYDADPECSRNNPDLIFGRWYRGPDSEAVINAYRCDTGQYETVVGVRDLVPNVDENGRTYLRGYTTGGEEWLSFIFGGVSQDQDRYCAYFQLGHESQTLKLLDTITGTINGHHVPAPFAWGFYLHACCSDHSGRYVILGPVMSSPFNNIIWDTQTDHFMPMAVHGGGHGVPGYMHNVNRPDDSDAAQTLLRSMATPDVVTELVVPYPQPPEFQADGHVSWNNAYFAAEPFASTPACLVGTYRYGAGLTNGGWREWDDEVISIAVTPTTVKRFCHHRSDIRHDMYPETHLGYWYTPRVNISPDGRFAIFTSNWEKTLGEDPIGAAEGAGHRQDVFLVQLVA